MHYRNERFRYQGAVLKSYFECCVAAMIERCGHRWVYEPYVHDPNRRTAYKPDFWVPELRLWIEPRGYQTATSNAQIDAFAGSIFRGMTVYRNETAKISQHAVSRYDPHAPAWQYHDYLVLHGSRHEPTRFSLFRSGGKAGWGTDVRDLVRRMCDNCHRWYIARWAMRECTRCGHVNSPERDRFDHIVGLPMWGLGFRSTTGEVEVIRNTDCVIDPLPSS